MYPKRRGQGTRGPNKPVRQKRNRRPKSAERMNGRETKTQNGKNIIGNAAGKKSKSPKKRVGARTARTRLFQIKPSVKPARKRRGGATQKGAPRLMRPERWSGTSPLLRKSRCGDLLSASTAGNYPCQALLSVSGAPNETAIWRSANGPKRRPKPQRRRKPSSYITSRRAEKRYSLKKPPQELIRLSLHLHPPHKARRMALPHPGYENPRRKDSPEKGEQSEPAGGSEERWPVRLLQRLTGLRENSLRTSSRSPKQKKQEVLCE